MSDDNPKPKPASVQLKHVAKAEGAFVMLELDLLTSPAWRGQSIYCRRLLDRLMIEHLRHAGTENGNLQVSYDQFVGAGIRRSSIRETLDEATDRGLLEVDGGQYRGAAKTTPSKYRLTFLPGMVMSELVGRRYYGKATHEWRRFKPPAKSISMGAKVPLEQYQRGEQARGKSAPRFHGNPPDRLGADVPPPSISCGERGTEDRHPLSASSLPPEANDQVNGPSTAPPAAPPTALRSGQLLPFRRQTKITDQRIGEMTRIALQATGSRLLPNPAQLDSVREAVVMHRVTIADMKRAAKPNPYSGPQTFDHIVRHAIRAAEERRGWPDDQAAH